MSTPIGLQPDVSAVSPVGPRRALEQLFRVAFCIALFTLLVAAWNEGGAGWMALSLGAAYGNFAAVLALLLLMPATFKKTPCDKLRAVAVVYAVTPIALALLLALFVPHLNVHGVTLPLLLLDSLLLEGSALVMFGKVIRQRRRSTLTQTEEE